MPENNTTSSSSAVSWVMNTSPDSSAMAPLFSSEADATDSPYFVVVVVTVEKLHRILEYHFVELQQKSSVKRCISGRARTF